MSRAGNDAIGTALVIGAISDIGRAIARRLAGEGCALQLAGRDAAGLEQKAQDIGVRTGAVVTVHRCDLLDADAAERVMRTNHADPALLTGTLADFVQEDGCRRNVRTTSPDAPDGERRARCTRRTRTRRPARS